MFYLALMKLTNILLLAGAAILGIGFYRKVQAAQNLTFSLASIRQQGALKDLQFVVTLNVINPSNRNLTVNGIGGKLFINDELVADVLNNTPQTIAPGASLFAVTAFINPMSAAAVIRSLNSKRVVARFQGNVRALGINIPVDFSQNLN